MNRLLSAWQLLTGSDDKLRFLFSSPAQVAVRAIHDYPNAAIWHDISVTASEALLGLVCGSMLGLGIGLLMWSSDRFGRMAKPYVVVLGSIPIFAIAPMLIMWFGIGLLAKVVMAAFGVFLVTVVQAYDGAAAAARQHMFFARSLGAQRGDILRKIILPGALRWFMTGIRINIGFALLGAFIGEFVNSDAGLGHAIIRAGSIYDMAGAIFGIINLSALALILNGVTVFVERRLFPWALAERAG